MPDASILAFPGPVAAPPAASPEDNREPSAMTRLSGRTRNAFMATGALLLVVGPMLALIPISGAVIASGEVTAESRAKTIVHPTGGVLAQLYVRDGQKVERNQVLMRFATSVTEPGARFSGESLSALLARKARLEAEVMGSTSLEMPAELARSTDPEAGAAFARELSVFRIRQDQLAMQLAMIDDQRQQIAEEIAGLRAQAGAINRQRTLLDPELKGLRNLYRQELVTINRLNEAERSDVSLAGEAATIQARIRQFEVKSQELAKQAMTLRETARSNAGGELNEVILALADGRIRQAGASDAYERSVIRAPQAGIVDSLAFSTIGSAVPGGEEILRIIPQTDAMVVQTRVAASDIEQVKVGQMARVNFSGLNQQTTPVVTGKVTFVSADRTEDPRTGASFYRVNVAIDARSFKKSTGLRITSGMPADAFITTSSRSMLSYIIKPMADQIERAFRDEN
jgi:HlyD family type I secretion membrane fusion protein